MKAKIGLMILPLLVAAGVAMGQGAEPGAAAAPDEAQAPDRNQVQRRTEVRDSHDRLMGTRPEGPVQDQAATRKAKLRQGADMRRCLNLKTNEAIIRCAEPGRKP